MSEFSLEALVALKSDAVKTNGSVTRVNTKIDMATIEELRERCVVIDGNRAKSPLTQALVIKCSKYALPLDIIEKGATRLNTRTEDVEERTALLLGAVKAGHFDTALYEAQAKAVAVTVAKDAPVVAPVIDDIDVEPVAE